MKHTGGFRHEHRAKLTLVLLTISLETYLCLPQAMAGGVISSCTETDLKNAISGGGSVTFSCNGTIVLSATVVINSNTSIDGTGQSITISGNNAVEIFSVNSGVTFSVNQITLSNAFNSHNSVEDGGAISNHGILIAQNSRFTGNIVNGSSIGGGAISNLGSATATIDNCIFVGNSTDGDGGAIINYGTLNVSNSSFDSNSAGALGGAILGYFGTITVLNSSFNFNSAYFGGGGIGNLDDTVLTVRNTIFRGNSTVHDGGAIDNESIAEITNSFFFNNSAAIGGAILAWDDVETGYTAVTNCTFCTFSGNVASFGGGAIGNSGYFTVTGSTLSSNSAFIGSGIYVFAPGTGTVSLTNSTLSANSSTALNGGAIWIDGFGTLTAVNDTLSGNSGASISNAGGTATLTNTILAGSSGNGECSGTVIDGGYNLSRDATCSFASAGSQNNVSAASLNLGALTSNGGPTPTIAPGIGSVAIDAIPNGTNGCGTTVLTDQRGIVRPQNLLCDIGAVELGSSVVVVKKARGQLTSF